MMGAVSSSCRAWRGRCAVLAGVAGAAGAGWSLESLWVGMMGAASSSCRGMHREVRSACGRCGCSRGKVLFGRSWLAWRCVSGAASSSWRGRCAPCLCCGCREEAPVGQGLGGDVQWGCVVARFGQVWLQGAVSSWRCTGWRALLPPPTHPPARPSPPHPPPARSLHARRAGGRV